MKTDIILTKKNVIVGVTSSISAYKACDVVSGLVKTGNFVQVVMTESSLRFAPIDVLAVLSKRPVLVDSAKNDPVVHHVDLVEWCDKFVIVPATFNTIMKIKNGIADNLLTDMVSVVGGLRKVKHIFPAMNTAMYNNPRLVSALNILKQEHWNVSGTDKGLLACGSIGEGKLMKPRKIVELINGE